jgi:hypothetical protein
LANSVWKGDKADYGYQELYEIVKLGIGENWLEPVLDVHTHHFQLLSPQFLYFFLFNLVAKKLVLSRKNIGGFCPPPPPPQIIIMTKILT